MNSPLPVDVVGPDWFDWLTLLVTVVFAGLGLVVSTIAAFAAVFTAGAALWIANLERRDRLRAEQRAAVLEEEARFTAASNIRVYLTLSVSASDERPQGMWTGRVANGSTNPITAVLVTVHPEGRPDLTQKLSPLKPALGPGDSADLVTSPDGAAFFSALGDVESRDPVWAAEFRDHLGTHWTIDRHGSPRHD